MANNVILVLEYDMGDYTIELKERGEISTNPSDYEEVFYQSDVAHPDLIIKDVYVRKTL